MENLINELKVVCGKLISPLVTKHGFVGPEIDDQDSYANVLYFGKKSAVKIQIEFKEETIDAGIALLVDGLLPQNEYVNGKKRFEYLGNILRDKKVSIIPFSEWKKKQGQNYDLLNDLSAKWMRPGLEMVVFYFEIYGDLLLIDREEILS
jgi:hypothetical protein